MKITKIKIIDTYFIAGNRTLFVMKEKDALSIGFPDTLLGELFVGGESFGKFTFHKERLIRRQKFDTEAYGIISDKQIIVDSGSKLKIAIEFEID